MSMLLFTLLRTPFPLLALYCFPFSPSVCLPFRVCKLFQLLSLPLLPFFVTLVTKVEGDFDVLRSHMWREFLEQSCETGQI